MNKQTNVGDKARFCQSFGFTIAIDWFDLQGIHHLDSDRRAVLELSTAGTHGEYVGFTVRIVSKTKGEIVCKCFRFADYLNARCDKRADYNDGFKVISHCGWQWYIAVPATTTALIMGIQTWIADWK